MKYVVFVVIAVITIDFVIAEVAYLSKPGQVNNHGTYENVPRFPHKIIRDGTWEDKFNPEFTNTYYHRTAKYSR